jgi:hypothetical protein
MPTVRSIALTTADAPRSAPTELVPVALGERDPEYIRRSLRYTWPLIAAWFRPFFQLAHHLVLAAPWLALLRRYGTIEVTWNGGRAAPDLGAAVPVYPGGDREAHRPSWHGHRIEFAGRDGFVRLALIDLRERYGPDPDVDAVHASITALMQRTLDELAAERCCPVSG